MRVFLISLALVSSVQGGVFESNGMNAIADLIGDIQDIKEAAQDLEIMETRLRGLDSQVDEVSSLKGTLTEAMDKSTLTFNEIHPNSEVETGELCVNTHKHFFLHCQLHNFPLRKRYENLQLTVYDNKQHYDIFIKDKIFPEKLKSIIVLSVIDDTIIKIFKVLMKNCVL